MKSKIPIVLILLAGFFIGIYYHYLLEQITDLSPFHYISVKKDSQVWNILAYLFTHFFTIMFSLSIIFIASVIMLENRNPSKTVAWLVILTMFPIIGFIFYIFVGRNVRKRRRYKHKTIDLNEMQQLIQIPYDLNEPEKLKRFPGRPQRIINFLWQSASSPMTRYNRVEVLTNGEATYKSMLEGMEKAQHHIHFITFILRDDGIGRQMKEIWMERAKAGVEVRLIIDGLGSRQLPSTYIQDLKEAGVQVIIFSPILFPYLRKVNYRNHRKIAVVDGTIGFLGGLNVGDEYLGKSERFSFWRDTHMKIEGDAAYLLQLIFLMDWNFISKEDITLSREYFPHHNIKEKHYVQIAASGPDSDWEYIQKVYFSLITGAQKTVYITTPYLIPDDSIIMALKTAALSGVDVRIVVPAVPDHMVVFWASRSYYTELLEAGVKIYTYHKGFIHAKIMIVDGEISTLGTANFDIRSFQYNFEVSSVVYDTDVAERLEGDFSQDMVDSSELSLKTFSRRPLLDKLKESVARLMSPLL
ncbi:cardiolipin synthase [Ammoniphilus resinae]|uniref:Cardiolipin synthase n=1 Tax=Ammoniphilus resinae TaxID=861532 RepID=A0ABS4GTM0_9BACL|nr:cardiolipin synthase [Ammoniphilus resinae]MBP1933615.1 cardiolipin synthase [Ammoniphilus resinae]